MNPASILSGFFSDFAIAVLTDKKTMSLVESNLESYMIRQGAYFSGWSASKLEYAARSLRRQEKMLHTLADRKQHEGHLDPEFARVIPKKRLEVLSIIRDCWVE